MPTKRIHIILMVFLGLWSCTNPNVEKAQPISKQASIYPDYSDIVIPYNIAPLNFKINEPGSEFFVRIINSKLKSLTIRSNSGLIQIPVKKWKKFLAENKGSDYKMEIYVKNGKWLAYQPIKNSIANESIDHYLMYRFINPANLLWKSMGIYQRNLENFDVDAIMDNSLSDHNCMHCHSVAANDPKYFMLHMRAAHGGTIVKTDKALNFVNTKTEQTISPGGYPSWHPSGKYIAFSTNKIHQKFHSLKEKYAFVYDDVSDIEMYNVEKNEIQAIPKLSTPDFENIPIWAPDGKYLYFVSAPFHKPDSVNYSEIKYGLKRIPYDLETNRWGDIEVLISPDSLHKSVSFPRISNDNKYVLLVVADYGYFPIYNETSNIGLFDLATRKLDTLGINTKYVESYPSWSSNNNWVMFNSKRDDGITSRPYFAYFKDGKVYKPFVLPQENPNWNIEEINNINRPEFSIGKIELTPKEILKLIKTNPTQATFDKSSMIGVKVDSIRSSENPNAEKYNQ
jgi:Tol biopolymer transport system component